MCMYVYMFMLEKEQEREQKRLKIFEGYSTSVGNRMLENLDWKQCLGDCWRCGCGLTYSRKVYGMRIGKIQE